MMVDICVCCGEPIPEGRMICWTCENKWMEVDNDAKVICSK